MHPHSKSSGLYHHTLSLAPPMHPLMLPAELVCKILHGMLLKDIMNTTRVWTNARDCADIILPFGTTLASIDTALIPRPAYRAILIQRRLKEATISPVRSFQPQFSDVPSWEPWIPPKTPLGFRGPLWCELLPGQIFLVGKRTAVGIYDLEGRYGHKFNFEGEVVDLDWMGGESGAYLTLGLLLVRDFEDSRRKVLCIYELTQPGSIAPIVSSPRYTALPGAAGAPGMCKGLSMRHRTVLMWGHDFILSLDLDSERGIYLRSPTNKAVVQNMSDWLPLANIAEENGGDPRILISTPLKTINLQDGVHQVRNFSGRPQFVLQTDSESMAVVNVDVHSTAPMWAIQDSGPPHIPREIVHNDCEYFWPCWTPSGQLFLFVLRSNRIEFFHYSSAQAVHRRYLDVSATQFVLSFSPSRRLHFSFDPVRGILLLLANGNVFVLKY
ncbi:hypothetical protein DFH09DRAFT_1436222 [Mycena vulgaris]|nr:hypothetical protein DFH09DRAFT_1436222 [Mycena vulgaris]